MSLNIFEYLFDSAMVLLVIRILTCLVALRCRTYFDHFGPIPDIGYIVNTGPTLDTGYDRVGAGPSPDLGLPLIQGAKRELVVGVCEPICSIVAVVSGIAFVAGLAYAAWKNHRRHKETYYTDTEVLNPEEEIVNHEEEVEDLKAEVEDLKEEVADLQDEVADLQEEVADFEEEVADLEDEVEHLEDEVLDLEDKVLDLEDEVFDLKEEVSDLKEEIVDLEDQLADLTEELLTKMADEEKLKEENQRLREGLKDAAGAIERLERLLKDKPEGAVNVVIQMNGKDVHIEDLLAENEKAKEDCKRLEDKLREAANNMYDMESLLKEKEDEKLEMINLYDDRIQDLLAENEKVKEDCRRLDEKLRNTANNMEEMESRLKEKGDEKIELVNLHDEQIQGLLTEKAKMKEDREDMKRRLQEKETVKSTLIHWHEIVVERQTALIQNLMANEKKLKNEHELLEEKLREALSKLENKERQLEKNEDEKNKLESEHFNQMELMDAQIQELLAKVWKMKLENEHLEERLEELLIKTENSNSQIQDLLGKLDGKECEIEELKNTFANIIENMNLQIHEAHNNLEELERALKIEEEEKTHITNLYEKMTESRDRQVRDLLAKEEELKEEREILREQLGETLSCVADIEKLLDEEQDTIKEKERQIEKLHQQEQELREKLQKKESEHEASSVRENELEILLNRETELLKDKEKEIILLRISIQDILQEKEQERESLQEQNDHLQEEVMQLQNSLVIAACNEETLKSELNCAKGQLHHLQKTESQNLQKYQKLTNECELLQKTCRKLEERNEKVEKCAREQKMMQEEALRMQDKYMLMGLLNNIARRDFKLQRILREEQENTGKGGEKPDIGRQDCGQETNQEFCCAQNDNRGYLKKQWLDVTDIVEDILHRDEKSPDKMAQNSGKNQE
ncbi:putative leucine-rich repeat-containing protein DDB_G0290503 [Macrobrachium nipponense]|uniref:putative leucine-rich repeat-containing protein DDB_G0290503 n=1 Tax=Macrobrachium nipponense TaxID=159736 RepID=UPI0030C7A55C